MDDGVRPTTPARLTWRLVRTVGGVVAAVLVLALIAVSLVTQRTANLSSARALERTTRLIGVLLREREAGLARAAQVFAQNPNFRSLLLGGRPEDLYDQAVEAAERTGASWVQVTDSVGLRLAKSDEATAPAILLAGSALIAGALAGESVGGVGTTGDTVLFQAIGVPVVGATTVAGALMATQVIDSALAAEVRATTESDVVFFVLGASGDAHVVASTLGRDAAVVAALSGTVGRRLVSGEDEAVPLALTRDDGHYVGRAAPLRSAAGDVLGGVAVLRSHDVEMASFAGLRLAIVSAGGAGLLLAFVLAMLTGRSLARPILALTQATRRVAEGDYEVAVRVESRDEIGTLAESIRTMITDLKEKASLVQVLEGKAGTRSPLAERAGATTPDSPGWRVSDEVDVVPGAVLASRYEILETLGAGGGGVVYRALDRELGEALALKTLHRDAVSDDPEALERFKSELRLARRLTHRNIVRTYDLGVAGGRYWITMELVSGTSLRALLDRERRLPLAAALSIGKQLFRALDVAHEAGILHRDIKPHNLMVQPDGTLKVMDFGIARAITRASALTQAGVVMGTPEYMAPEQLLGEAIDARADLFSAGVVLFECLTGRRPIEAESPTVLIARLLRDPMPAANSIEPSIPRDLSDLLARLLSRDPRQRPERGSQVFAALQVMAP